jgi:hypothetical protein
MSERKVFVYMSKRKMSVWKAELSVTVTVIFALKLLGFALSLSVTVTFLSPKPLPLIPFTLPDHHILFVGGPNHLNEESTFPHNSSPLSC